MISHLDRQSGDDRTLVIHYSTLEGVWLFFIGIFGMLSAFGLFLLAVLVTNLRRVWSESGPLGMAWIVAVSLVFVLGGPIAARAAALCWRCIRRGWWLRLSSEGFEVNDRVFTPRRYQWSEIDKFMLDGGEIEGTYVPYVSFSYKPNRHVSPTTQLTRLSGPPRDRDGTKVAVAVDGQWDRPLDEAVDLMNQWLTRHKATVTERPEPTIW